jgi:hypothetical protein
MYGRLRMLCQALVGRTPRLFSIGAITVYPGFGHAADRMPSGMRVLAGEDHAGVGEEASQKISRM